MAEHLAGYQIDDLGPCKYEKGRNVEHCERFSAGHERKRKRTHGRAFALAKW